MSLFLSHYTGFDGQEGYGNPFGRVMSCRYEEKMPKD